MILNCIAVDDEPLALDLICRFIEQTPFLHLAGCYGSSIEALTPLQEETIDVIFLDIQMSDLTGMDLARLLSQQTGSTPRVIFTTAYNHFALEGYRVDALDYLLKPFNYDEFLRAATKARNYFSIQGTMPPRTPEDRYLFLKVEQRWQKVSYDDVRYIESYKDYVKVHLVSDTRPVLSLITMKALEEKLPSSLFMRVHRSYIVSLDKITSVTKTSLQIGEMNIQIGDQYKEDFRQFFGTIG